MSIGLLVITLLASLINAPACAQGTNALDIAKEIVVDVGTIGETYTAGKRGPVFVFEENHTARAGQLQIAVMMLRLHDHFGLKEIALEGMIQRPRPLDGSWFHQAGGATAGSHREDVAVRMLSEGEISAAEFMTLLYPDIKVYGTEISRLYDVKLDSLTTNPLVGYLYYIAAKDLTQAEIRKVNRLADQGKVDEARELIFNSDPWVKRHYEAIIDTSGVVSIEALIGRIHDIQRKARSENVSIDPVVKAEMDNLLQFYEAAGKRSDVLVEYASTMNTVAANEPVAVNIGAAHTERVLHLLKEKGISYVQITPRAFTPRPGVSTIGAYKRKTDGQWARISPGTLGHLLNTPRKPKPVIEDPGAKSYANMNFAAILLAAIARDEENLESEEVWRQIATLPELRVDRESVTQDGYDVIFRAWLKNTQGREKEVWARVGSLDTPVQARSIEDKLKQAIRDLDGGFNDIIPPTPPPPNSQPVDNEGPGDGKRNGQVINRLNPKTVAVFGNDQKTVLQVGQISS